jgi:hypothetical protein
MKEFNWDNAPVICELNGFKWLLGPESEESMDWEDAKEWCEAQGGVLPPRDILLHAYLNQETTGDFADDYYWSSSEDGSDFAWYQYFIDGIQYSFDKDGTSIRVRAVRAVVESGLRWLPNK